ncbi:MAG: 4-(cytidine 5'-diphospho)-2-C-methyl-D-erythritol kinase [Candidatus Omnitrophota bacterium]
MKPLLFKSPAKLNLFLRVINKRPDGYHNLQTLFERINLFDDLYFSTVKSGDITISCDHPHVPCGPGNLIYKIADYIKSTYGLKYGVHVKLNKRIPVAAGLAGGSSNAATTLIALNKLWKLGLKKARLIEIGNMFGSDIAFFLHDCSWALGEGRGEIISPLDIKSKIDHILVVPKKKMSTPKVYQALNLKLTNKKDNVNILIHSLKEKDIVKSSQFLFNDLEHSILTIDPKLDVVKKRLKSLENKGVSFSGSGPSLFGLTKSNQEAKDLCDALKKRYEQVYVVRTC